MGRSSFFPIIESARSASQILCSSDFIVSIESPLETVEPTATRRRSTVPGNGDLTVAISLFGSWTRASKEPLLTWAPQFADTIVWPSCHSARFAAEFAGAHAARVAGVSHQLRTL